MALKTTNITIDKGRDAGKRFFIKEMTAFDIEWWAARLLISALGAENVDLTKVAAMGTLAQMGISLIAKVQKEDAKPLMDEMLSCVTIAPNPKDPTVQRPVDADDIEDVTTLFKLRVEWFKLHADFLKQGEE